jgi:hypothetical protein
MGQVITLIPKRSWLPHAGILPVLLAAVMPKCPLCLMAYAGMLGMFGIDPFLYSVWVLPLTIVFSAFTLLVFLCQARRNNRYFAFGGALCAIAFVVLEKFYLSSNWIIYPAIAALLISSVLISTPRKPGPERPGCHG